MCKVLVIRAECRSIETGATVYGCTMLSEGFTLPTRVFAMSRTGSPRLWHRCWSINCILAWKNGSFKNVFQSLTYSQHKATHSKKDSEPFKRQNINTKYSTTNPQITTCLSNFWGDVVVVFVRSNYECVSGRRILKLERFKLTYRSYLVDRGRDWGR